MNDRDVIRYTLRRLSRRLRLVRAVTAGNRFLVVGLLLGLAPLLAKVGPQLAGATIDLARALDAPASTVTTTSSGASGAASTGGEPQLDQRKMMELQYAMDKQKEMFSLVSNILRSMHDMKMVAVQNVRS